MKNLIKILSYICWFISSVDAWSQPNFNHPVSGSTTITLNPGTYYYYDNGGPTSNYSNNILGSSMQFIPRAGCKLHFWFEDYQVEADGNPCYDYMEYNYSPCGGFPVYNKLCDVNLGWNELLCVGEMIRFFFTSDGSVTARGWKVRIIVEEKTPLNTICSVGGEVGGPCKVDPQESFHCDVLTSHNIGFTCPWTCDKGMIDIYPGCSGQVFGGAETVWELTVDEESDITFTTPCPDHLFLILPGCSCLAKATKTGNDFLFKKVQPGTYYVVAEFDCLKGCASEVKLKCKKYCPTVFEYCDLGGPLTMDYAGNGTSLTYKFSSTYPIAPGEQWMVKDYTGRVISSTAGSNTTMNYTFPAAGEYEICFPYLDANRCVVYCCIRICALIPFQCDYIGLRFHESGNYFSFDIPNDVGGSGIEEWRMGDNLSNTVAINKSRWPLPPGWNCRDQVICVKFYDPHRLCWVFCCRRVWICNPFNCLDIQYRFKPLENKYELSFADSLNPYYSNFEWQIDSSQAISIGRGPRTIWYPPQGLDCRYYTISLRYYDSRCACWKICCRRIWFCNPLICNDIKPGLRPSINSYTFEITHPSASLKPIQWSLDETGDQLGQTQSISYNPPLSLPCGIYTLSVKFWDGVGWRLCCIRVYLCDPKRCAGNIFTTYNNPILNMSTLPGFQNLQWYFNLQNNPVNSSIQTAPGSYTIDLLYFDTNGFFWNRCRKEKIPVAVSDVRIIRVDLYPNPANDELYIASMDQFGDNPSLELLSMDGHLHKIEGASFKDGIKLDLRSFPSGMYFLNIRGNRFSAQSKLIINRP